MTWFKVTSLALLSLPCAALTTMMRKELFSNKRLNIWTVGIVRAMGLKVDNYLFRGLFNFDIIMVVLYVYNRGNTKWVKSITK